MTITAHIYDRRDPFSVDVVLSREGDGGRWVAEVNHAGGITWQPVTDHSVETLPTLRLDPASARALLDALVARFHGTNDPVLLRRDYDAERARVDKILEVVAFMATAPARIDAAKLGASL